MILTVPTQEHGMSFHLFRSCFMSLISILKFPIMFLKFIPKYFISYVFGYYKMTFSFLTECNWTLCIQRLFPEN